jgi:hypothetical protein
MEKFLFGQRSRNAMSHLLILYHGKLIKLPETRWIVRQFGAFGAYEVAFFLACIPLAMAPPIAALAIIFINMRYDMPRDQTRKWFNPLIIAIGNIIGSLFVLHLVFVDIIEYTNVFIGWLRAWLVMNSASQLKPIPL